MILTDSSTDVTQADITLLDRGLSNESELPVVY